MSRTLGFFLGSAAVFAMLVYLLGQPVPLAPPDRHAGGPQHDGMAMSAPVAIPPPPSPAGPPVSGVAEPEPVAVPASPPASAAAAAVPSPPAAPESRAPVDENALAAAWLGADAQQGPPAESGQQDYADAQSGAPTLPADNAMANEQAWFPVWDPFHSELSANAFARRLERVTGLDYRVIKTGPAEYRVAVAYTSEEERIANVAAIEEATGLSIAGGSR